jgi:ATP-dependent DNA ligase
MAVETIWSYLESLGYSVKERDEKHVVPFVLESEKLNKAQAKRMSGIGMYSEKLDGVYAMVTIINGEVRHWNRTGKAMSNTQLLDGCIECAIADNGFIDTPIIAISEVTSEDPLAKLSGYLNPNRVNDSSFEPTNLRDNFHDIVNVEEFIAGVSKDRFASRYNRTKIFMHDILNLRVIPMNEGTLQSAREFANAVWGRHGEGVVFAQMDGPWIAGARDETKIKIKEKLSFDVTVVGMVSGKQGSKYEHTLGKLVVAFRAFGEPDGKWLWIPISGMTDTLRDLWWNNPTLIVGETVKMDAKSFTENGNLREPRFKEVRHDKGSEFPVKVLEDVSEFTKGKARHFIHELEIDL